MLLVRMLGIAAKTRGHTEGSLWLKKEYYRKSGSVTLQNFLRLLDNARQHGSIEERIKQTNTVILP